MKQLIIEKLEELSLVIQQLASDEYKNPIKSLGGATIGQHARHVIELFQCLDKHYESGAVNYDLRKRNLEIETNIGYAAECLRQIIRTIDKPDKTLYVIYPIESSAPLSISSSYNRELLYNLEHCIHHEALIRVAFQESLVSVNYDNFGVSPSTIQYRKQQNHS